MSMPRLLHHRDALRLLAAVVLLGWFLRALVPAGFMPGTGGGHAGLPGLVICSQGMPHGFVPGSEKPLPDAASTLHCVAGAPYSQLALPGPSGIVLSALLLWLVLCAHRRCRVHVSRFAGPPVGSRAPPSRTVLPLFQPA